MTPGHDGGFTKIHPENETAFIYDAAQAYQEKGTPLVVFAGLEYGTGSSRDWAAKGSRLLGVRAVVTQSFERIHRSNLIGMGVLPLQFEEGQSWQSLDLQGREQVSIDWGGTITPGQENDRNHHLPRRQGRRRSPSKAVSIRKREAAYMNHGGILHYVLRALAA